MKILEVNGLNKTYEKFELRNVSFDLDEGYIMGFIGANGAGKTTTLKSILNMINFESGDINILGESFSENESKLKQSIGYMFGDADFYTRRKIKVITAVVKRFYTNWDEGTYQSLIKRFNLDEDKKLMELSQGMKIKYSLVLALSHEAKLLLLDEPTSGLDPVARDELLELFQELVEDGKTSILFSTHITSDLVKCADYITYINNGEIISSKTQDEFKASYRLIKGPMSMIDEIKDKLISYKTSSFNFTGLAETGSVKANENIKEEEPELDDIMIYFARRDRQDA
jgi:ABC-2 type transport system ATP-binding protein